MVTGFCFEMMLVQKDSALLCLSPCEAQLKGHVNNKRPGTSFAVNVKTTQHWTKSAKVRVLIEAFMSTESR